MFEKKINIENKEELMPYLLNSNFRTSGISFTSLYMWRNINLFGYKKIGEYMCLAGDCLLEVENPVPFMLPPLSATGMYDAQKLRETILDAKAHFEAKRAEFVMYVVPEEILAELKKAFPTELQVTADRDNSDYLYLKQELIDLAGRAHHGKKNHLNYFQRNYEYEYRELTPDCIEDAMAFLDDFQSEKGFADLNEEVWFDMEKRATADLIQNIDKVECMAAAIYINGKIEALTIGAVTSPDTVTVHIEKANKDYRGLYQAINNEFCKRLPENIVYVNREEDIGIETLRKAKLSYKPIRLVDKYIVKIAT